MSSHDVFIAAASTLSNAGFYGDLCRPFVEAVHVTGAAISTLGNPLGSQTICASDAVAARISEIQIDLGEGPAWVAMRSRTPVLVADLREGTDASWPLAQEALRLAHAGSLFAFPLHVGILDVGSVDLYVAGPHQLTPLEVGSSISLAAIAARQVLRRALANLGQTDDGPVGGIYSRREMHQASGMIAAQLKIGVDDALVVLRGHAFAAGRTVLEVAHAVVERELNFADEGQAQT